MSQYFRTPTGSPFCAVCGHTVPGHWGDCPVLTQEPQQGVQGVQGAQQAQPFQWESDHFQGTPLSGSWHGAPRTPDYTALLERIAVALETLCKQVK